MIIFSIMLKKKNKVWTYTCVYEIHTFQDRFCSDDNQFPQKGKVGENILGQFSVSK